MHIHPYIHTCIHIYERECVFEFKCVFIKQPGFVGASNGTMRFIPRPFTTMRSIPRWREDYPTRL